MKGEWRMDYIVIFQVFNAEEVYYCEDLEQVKQLIKDMCASQEEMERVRVFKLSNEIVVKSLID